MTEEVPSLDDVRANIASAIESNEEEVATDDLPEEQEDEIEEEGEADDEELEEEPEEEEEPKDKGIMIPKARLDEALGERNHYKRQYEELVVAIERIDLADQKKSGKKDEAEEFDPLDEEAWNKTEEKFSEFEQKQLIKDYTRDIKLEEKEAAQKYPDWQERYSFYVNETVANIKEAYEERGKEISDEDAKRVAAQQLAAFTFQRYQNGLPIADHIAKRVEKLGYKPPKQTGGKGPDIEALEKNEKRTGQRKLDKKQPDAKHETVKDMIKPGMGADLKKFRAQLEKQITSAS